MPHVNNTVFTHNWNNKLLAASFTTLRMYNDRKYAVHSIHEIYLGDKQLGKAKVLAMRQITTDKLNEWIARLDTGYSLPETLRILGKMYPNHSPLRLSWVLFAWEEVYPDHAELIPLRLKLPMK